MSDWSDGVTGSKGGGGNLSGIGTGLQIGGVINSTLGAYKKSEGEQQAYQFQSKVASNNAAIADMQAKDAMLRGATAVQNVKQRTANLKSTQTASLASRNIDLGEGSPLNILTSTDVMGERDALIVQDNANKEVWGLQNQAANFRDNAALLDWRGNQTSPMGDAATTLLTGAGKVAASWYSMRNQVAGYNA